MKKPSTVVIEKNLGARKGYTVSEVATGLRLTWFRLKGEAVLAAKIFDAQGVSPDLVEMAEKGCPISPKLDIGEGEMGPSNDLGVGTEVAA